jgi:hypothetical protein
MERDSVVTIVMSQYLVCSDSIVAVVVRSENDTCEGLLSRFPDSLLYVSGKRIRAEVEEGVLVAKMFSAVVVVVRHPTVLYIAFIRWSVLASRLLRLVVVYAVWFLLMLLLSLVSPLEKSVPKLSVVPSSMVVFCALAVAAVVEVSLLGVVLAGGLLSCGELGKPFAVCSLVFFKVRFATSSTLIASNLFTISISKQGTIETTTYIKPKNLHLYIPAMSAHPRLPKRHHLRKPHLLLESEQQHL